MKLEPKFTRLLDSCKDPEVRDYIESVFQAIIDDYGKIEDSFYISLKFIRDNFEIYNKANKAVQEEGLVISDSQGRRVKNQNCQSMFEAQRTIESLLTKFALTPLSKTKMSKLKKDAGESKRTALDRFLEEE